MSQSCDIGLAAIFSFDGQAAFGNAQTATYLAYVDDPLHAAGRVGLLRAGWCAYRTPIRSRSATALL